MNRSKSSLLAGRHRRLGTTYVLLISTAMLVTIIGLGSISIARVEHRGALDNQDSVKARAMAQSAIEWGFLMTRFAGWQSFMGTGSWLTDETLGNGTISLDATILTGQPIVDGLFPVMFVGKGQCGNAIHRVEVTAIPLDGGMAVDPGTWKHVISTPIIIVK